METLPDLMLWPRAAAQWPHLTAAARRSLLDAAASSLHEAWRSAADLRATPFCALAFHPGPRGIEARLPASLLRRLNRPLSPPQLRDVLSGWFNEVRAHLRPGEALRFLRGMLPALTRDQFRFQARAIRSMADAARRRRARGLYAEFLGQGRGAPPILLQGRWLLQPSMRPDELLAALQAAEQSPDARFVKSGPAIRVIRTTLCGADVIIKRYDLARGWPAWKYRGRASRARRAWAAGQTLRALGIATPEPLGFLEVYRGRIPVTSYAVTNFVPDAVSAFRWVRKHYRSLDEAGRRQVRHELRLALAQLYEAGVYHGDTKLTNLLIQQEPTDAGRRWFWTDLECLRAGGTLTRRRLLRNLVQLNGSLRHWVPESDRIDFLRALAVERPWLAGPRVAESIRRRSRRRLLRELTGRTPPDGRPSP